MNSSYIEKIHLKNFRQFKVLDVEFNKKFNFIAGPNGCGKTSILAGISHCFYQGSTQYSRFQNDTEFWTDITSSGEKKRIGLGKTSIGNQGYRSQDIASWSHPESEEGRKTFLIYETLDDFCPLFIGADRSVKYKQISGMSREESFERRRQEYKESGTYLLYGDKETNIKQWFINRYFIIEKEWALEERENWKRLIEHLPILAPFNSDFSYIRTGKDLEPVFSIYGEECYMEELSAGFQAVLSIVARIFEWIEGTRKDGDKKAIEASGTVLIDELDLHLHPEWQFTLRNGLSSLFPNIQFIVTTHSPHLLSSAKENEIIIMERDINKNEYKLKPTSKKFSGWNTDQILSEVMGVVSLENKDYQVLINNAFDQIEGKSIDGLKSAIDALSTIAHPSDSILTILNARYASMVALSDD
ncbi:hypothetical protein AH4AK4_3049 [Aeromonas hydrophila 4AK4]|nr:hypothetical protein AH4AK4_3049 [Aeromonas hydrophila 4AK4]